MVAMAAMNSALSSSSSHVTIGSSAFCREVGRKAETSRCAWNTPDGVSTLWEGGHGRPLYMTEMSAVQGQKCPLYR